MQVILVLGIVGKKCAGLSSYITVCLMEEEFRIRHTRRSSAPRYLRFSATCSFPPKSLSIFLYTHCPFLKPFSSRS
jgi:hypothetical protein